MTNGAGKTLYAVLIEWDGFPPPGVWYNYQEQLTGFTIRRGRDAANPLQAFAPRGFSTVVGDDFDEEINPKNVLTDRSNDFGGMVQEGCIVVASYSLARALYLLLKRGFQVKGRKDGQFRTVTPSNVLLTTLVIENDFHASPADELALSRMKSIVSKRGPKPTEQQFVVTCYEDVQTFDTETSGVIGCPKCGGQHIRSRLGEMIRYSDPGGDFFEAWQRQRFAHGHWESTGAGAVVPPAIDDIIITDADEAAFIQSLQGSPLMQQLAGMSRSDQMTVLDSVLIIRLRWLEVRRLHARSAALTQYFMQGGNPLAISLSEGAPDLLDASGILGAEFVAAHMIKFLTKPVKVAKAAKVAPVHVNGDSGLTYEPIEESA